MKTVLVRYKTHAEKAGENETLIHAVFDELRASAPAGLRYGAFKLADGTSFVHFATIDTADGSNPLVELPSFKRFQENLSERCAEEPALTELSAVDGYW
ncbi:MAG TPA: hypothetical protein VKG44_06235 [Candidatus Baltobacteraceae bacterium]|nr:hypothetical protein [Candidatus Baltobacteraceae bacterium]